jgi:hypothetical protein
MKTPLTPLAGQPPYGNPTANCVAWRCRCPSSRTRMSEVVCKRSSHGYALKFPNRFPWACWHCGR